MRITYTALVLLMSASSQGAAAGHSAGDAERGATATFATATLGEAAPTTGTGGAAMAARSKLSNYAAKWLQLEKDTGETDLAFAGRYVPNESSRPAALRCADLTRTTFDSLLQGHGGNSTAATLAADGCCHQVHGDGGCGGRRQH
jgi:hypothetical protein